MHVFVYGTLMWDEVWEQVVRGHYVKISGEVTGWRRYSVRGECYPGLVPGRGKVQGIIRKNISAGDLRRLDRFEGKEYRRLSCTATEENGACITVFLYRYRESLHRRLMRRRWMPDEFSDEMLQRFLRTRM